MPESDRSALEISFPLVGQIIRLRYLFKTGGLRLLLSFLAALGASYGALCGLVYLKQDSLIYFPSPVLAVDPGEFGIRFESFELPLSGSTVTGWLVRTERPDAPWVMHFHGNGGNISSNIGYLALFLKLGLNGVVFDYRGYGRSRGHPSESGLLQDARAVRDYLIAEQGVNRDKLVFFGESLGGGVACALAAEESPAGLILKSTFTSVPAVAGEIYPFLPVDRLARTRFDSASRIATIPCPKLFVHGTADEIVPYRLGRRLFELAGEPKSFLDIPGGHNTGPLELGREFTEAIGDFVRKVCESEDC